MMTHFIAKRIFTRSPLAYSRNFVCVGKHPCFQLLNGTKVDIANNSRFFTSASRAKPPTLDGKTSTLREFLSWLGRDRRKKREVKTLISRKGLEIEVNVSGFGKDDMKVEIEDGNLMINGVAEDLMGNSIEIGETITINDLFKSDSENLWEIPITIRFKYDPEIFWAETRNGLLKVRIPFSDNKEDENKKGRYSAKWI